MKGCLLVGSILTDKFFAGELIPEGHNFKLAVVAHKDIANKEVVQFDLGVLDLLEEYFVVFNIVLSKGSATISICWAGTK